MCVTECSIHIGIYYTVQRSECVDENQLFSTTRGMRLWKCEPLFRNWCALTWYLCKYFIHFTMKLDARNVLSINIGKRSLSKIVILATMLVFIEGNNPNHEIHRCLWINEQWATKCLTKMTSYFCLSLKIASQTKQNHLRMILFRLICVVQFFFL